MSAGSSAQPLVRQARVERWRYRLRQAVGGSGVTFVDLVVVELEDADGCTGMGFSYVLNASAAAAAAAAKEQVAQFVLDQPHLHPEALWRRIHAALNRTGAGPALIGLAAIDLASWDLHARRHGVPVGIAMGGQPRPVPVYGSGGFHAGQATASVLEQVARYRAQGLHAVKLRVSGAAHELQRIEDVAASLDAGTSLMLDANEKCSLPEALRLLSVARAAGALFVEEPLPAHAAAAYAQLRGQGVAVATGEHLQGSSEWGPFVREGLCAVIQPDLAMAGGLTGALHMARAAELHGLDVAPHFLPAVFVHLAAACPRVTWLEDFPLLEPLLEPVPSYQLEDGTLPAATAPGLGLRWASGAREACLVTD